MTESSSELILVAGASARAAAASCLRAGLALTAADLFADADLVAVCPTTRLEAYPRRLARVIRDTPAAAWMFTGALENHPALVDRLARALPLLGNSGASLRRVRDPWELQAVLRRHQLQYPAIHRMAPPANAGRWLVKPRRSAGGAHIRFAAQHDIPAPVDALHTDAASGEERYARSVYYQQWVDGRPCSAVYVATGGHALLLGASQQLIGCDWTGGEGFHYCGSIGPLPLSAAQRTMLTRIGDVVAGEFALQGLFGIDVIQQGDQCCVIEVNPRYTASVEILERGLVLHAVALHVAACRGRTPDDLPPLPQHSDEQLRQWFGKAVVYARRTVTINEKFFDWAMQANANTSWPQIADIPHAGEIIHSRQPITTVFATGPTSDKLLQHLQLAVANVRRLLRE